MNAEYKKGDIVYVRAPVAVYDHIAKHEIFRLIIQGSKANRIGGQATSISTGKEIYLTTKGSSHLYGSDWDILPLVYAKYYERFGKAPPKELEEFLCQN